MKSIVIIAGGIADRPIQSINDRTPLEVARTEALDALASAGKSGTMRLIPNNVMPLPETSFYSIFGYERAKNLSGHAPLIACQMNYAVDEDDVAFMASFVTIGLEGRIADPFAGGIKTEEAKNLLKKLQNVNDRQLVRFFPVEGGEHLMMIKKGALGGGNFTADCVPPFRINGQLHDQWLPQGEGADILQRIMKESRRVLADSEVNQVRIDLKENPANMIWLWGQGVKTDLQPFGDKFGLSGAVVSRKKSFCGFAQMISCRVAKLDEVSEDIGCEYQMYADAAIAESEYHDIVFVYTDIPRQLSADGDIREKVKAIEMFDKELLARILRWQQKEECRRVAVLTDTAFPLEKMVDTAEPVPFAFAGEGIDADEVAVFSERAAGTSGLQLKTGDDFLGTLFQKAEKHIKT